MIILIYALASNYSMRLLYPSKQNLFFIFHDYYKNVRNEANHFSNQTFVLFQNKISQSRYEVSVIFPAFLLSRVDLRKDNLLL